MHALTWLATTPTPSPTATVNPDNVTPGVAGFIGTAVIVLAVVFLLIDMLRRIRRAGYRAEISEQLDAEQFAAEQEDSKGAAGGSPSPTGDVSPEGPAKG
jgi:hypothetical protein